MADHTAQKKLEKFKEKQELFKEMIDLEKVLLKIISLAVPEIFLKPYQNQYSNGNTTSIPDIFDDLMTTYGVVPEEDLIAADSALRARVFDISQLLVIIYNEMDDLQQLTIAAGLPYTDAQFFKLGVCLIKNINNFDKGLTKWFEKPSGQNYIAFKTHFTTAKNHLRRVQGPTIQSEILRQQENLISNNILNQLKEEQEGYMNAVSAVEQQIIKAVGNFTPETIDKWEQ